MTTRTLAPAARSATPSPSRRIREEVGRVFTHCLNAYFAFAGVGDLAENLRVLSLNAELAAGRAGDRGRAIRVLTQYTRELVTRMMQIHHDMVKIKAITYGSSADALRVLHRLNFLDMAQHQAGCPDAGEAEDAGGGRGSTRAALERASRAEFTAILNAVDRLVGSIGQLENLARLIAEVVAQSDSIATNIAIEAASAGAFEVEFSHVATTMRGYVEKLREIIDEAGGAVREAVKSGYSLKRHAQGLAGQESQAQGRAAAPGKRRNAG